MSSGNTMSVQFASRVTRFAVVPSRPASQAAARRWIARGGLAYGAAAVVMWLGGWTLQFLNALHGGLGK